MNPFLSEKYRLLHMGVHYLAESFGSARRDDLRRELRPDGEDIAQGLTSQGWAIVRGDHLVLTDAGYACDFATSDTPQAFHA